MAIALALVDLLCLAFIAWLTIDGLRALFARRAQESARRPLTLIVNERREIAGELLCLRLKDAKGRALNTFEAGQHLLVQAPAGPGGKLIQRAYSLAAWHKAPTSYELGIKREAQGMMSQWLWANVKPGDRLAVSRPQGDFVMSGGSGLLVLVGGGIGITPMRAMLHVALAGGGRIVLFHAARTADRLLYRAEFEALARQYVRFDYRAILSRPDPAWAGAVGHLDAPRILADLPHRALADFYLCASNAMMDALQEDLEAAGIAAGSIHREAFGATAGAGIAGLKLTLKQSGTERSVQTAGEPSLLATLEANGIALPSECRAGSCGQCVATLKSGDVKWLAEPESALAPGNILPCICSAQSDLELSIG